MALQQDYVKNKASGETYPDAYWYLGEPFISYAHGYATLEVFVYKAKANRDAQKEADGNPNDYALTRKSYKVEGDDFDDYFGYEALSQADKNPASQGYLYLKTLDDFSGAQDA